MRYILFFIFFINLSYSQTQDKKFDVGLSYALSHDSFIHNNPFTLGGSYKFKEFDKVDLKGGLNIFWFGVSKSAKGGVTSEWGINPNVIGSLDLVDKKLFLNFGIGYYLGRFSMVYEHREDLNSGVVLKNTKVNHHGLTLTSGIRYYPISTFFIDKHFIF